MAEGARLESVFRLTPNEGSNPSLSAIFNQKAHANAWAFCFSVASLNRRINAKIEIYVNLTGQIKSLNLQLKFDLIIQLILLALFFVFRMPVIYLQ